MINRITKQKLLIEKVVKSHMDHPSADQIYLEVRALDDRISRGTVYRNLEYLSKAGILTHVELPDADRYDSRVGLHYHMKCNKCGAVFDAPIEYKEEIDKIVFEMSGFQVDKHNMVFVGVCADCRKDS